MVDSNKESFDDCILYELLVYSEWKQDPEILKYIKRNDSFVGRILQSCRKHESSCDIIDRILHHHLPWHLAVGEEGKVVAILQDTVLEIRTSRDEYSSVVGKASIAKDANPQWRKLSWSPDCSMIAVGHSNGVVSLYDLLGSNIFNIYPQRFQENQQCDKNKSLAFLGFLQSRRKSPKWSAELITVDYDGELNCYLVSPTDGYQKCHSFSFAKQYPHGITAVGYHPSHDMLFVSGPSCFGGFDKLKNRGISLGLTSWRLSDFPFCKLALSKDEEQDMWNSQNSWWNWIPSITTKANQSTIFKLQVSPGGKFLACLHICGSISIWHVPGLRLYKYWHLQDQPDHNVESPLDKRHYDYSNDCVYQPVDINWWSDHAVIVARHSGAVSVCTITNLQNLLGESPEFLAGSPQVSAICCDQGFLGLECETVFTIKKRPWDDHPTTGTENSDENEVDLDDDETSLLNKGISAVKTVMYVITDMERFQPKKKRPKFCQKTYRLLGLKSTTPYELYTRKIDSEEYGEALALAKAYNLDADFVYQQQWRNNKVSVVTIHDYLSKVTKRNWVVKECLERVPETFVAARELLQFGLDETSINKVFSDGFGDAMQWESIEDEDADQEEKIRKIEDCLLKVDVNDIRYEEQTLLLYRQELLKYFDRLCTYEIIMGGPHMAEEFYDSKFYDNFRSVSPLESTVKFAREGNWKAVEIMFTYHGDIILSHWLPVLSSFPETVNPYKYRSLLPECDAQGNVFSWNQIKLREEDWCEKSNLMNPEKNGSTDTSYLSSLKKFECNEGKITADVLTSWFIERVHEIEGNSCMVDHALSLTKLAKERNVKSQCLEHLYDQLLTLDILVYDVHLEGVKLSDLQKMSQLDICKLLMSKTSATTFTEDLRRLLLPFLLRCEKSSPGSRSQLLRDYLIDLSSHDLSLPLKMMESIKTDVSNPLVPTVEESISLALSCVYAYPHCDQLHIAFQILHCIPEKTYSNTVYEKLKELECDLEAARILERNDIHKPLAFIQENKKLADVAQQLFTRLARNLVKKVHSPTENDWSQLLNDILDLQRKCFTCISVETCYENPQLRMIRRLIEIMILEKKQIYSISILASGSEKNIESAANILQCHEYDYRGKKVLYKESVKLVVQAALEYFDSAGSLADRTIDLAKACLNLIRDENEDIKELQDLITALQLLNDFGITMLPLQVRLCTERLRLVEKCIRSKPSAYRNTQKLLDLAHKLQACDKDKREREGRVLVLIAEAALQVFDYEFCAEICKQLLAKHHAIGWQVMQKLGQCEDFDDLNLRCELLGFALLFSPPDVIETLVNIRCSLEAHLLQQGISEHTKQDAVSDEEQFSDALTYPSPPSKESPVRRSNHMLQNPNYSKPSARSENCLFSENSFPAFYCALEPTCHVSSLSSQYDRFSDPEITDPVLMMSQTILRVRQLKCSTSQEICGSNAEVLLQVAERCILEDMSLGLSHVLPVTDISVVDACLSQLAWASLALQLTAYCYALNGFKSMQDPAAVDKLNQQHLYYISPTKLIQHMIKVASENTTEWTKMLLKYKENMMDIHEGEKLQSLGCGIDLHRFALEKQYQEDSILGLAMTVDEDKFLLAITLASRHGVSVEEVVARHITSLLLNSEANWNSVLTRRWQNPHLLELVKLNPDLICNRLFQYAYPSIDGTDHQRILSFFTIIETVAEDNVYCSLSPKEHIKLIKKVKAASSDIDYKRFVEPSNNILQVVTPALQRNNIDMIAKLLKTLPLSLKCTVHPGGLYSAWAQKEFFKVGVSREQTTSENWLEQYELCAAHFNKMKATDVLSFVDGTCFSKQAVELVPMESRITILNRVKGFCQLQTASSSEDKDDGWSEIIQTLVQRLNHLKTVSSLDTQDYHQYRHLLRLFDLSKGDSTQLDRIVEVAVMSSMSIESLRAFVAKVAGSLKSFEQCLASILKNAVENTRNNPEASEVLVNILQRMKENLKYGCTFVPPEVETLCTNPHLSPEIKLKAVELLQSSKPDQMLLYHHIQAIVASAWTHSGISFQEADLETEEKQVKVFVNMLEAADTWQQLLLLKDLLERWPQIAESCSSEAENPWLQLTYKMLTFKGEDIEDRESLLEDIFQKAKFTGKCIQYLVLIGEESVDVTYLLLLCLLSDESSLHTTAENLIRKHMHVDSTVLSDKLISLMLHKGLAPRLVTTPAYPQMIEHLVTKYAYDKSLWDSIINQLIDSEKFAEAGAISLLQMEIPCSLYVFSSSLSCMDTSSPDE